MKKFRYVFSDIGKYSVKRLDNKRIALFTIRKWLLFLRKKVPSKFRVPFKFEMLPTALINFPCGLPHRNIKAPFFKFTLELYYVDYRMHLENLY